MKNLVAVASTLIFSLNAFATLECEQRMLKAFKAQKIDVNKASTTQDNLHPTQDKMAKCMYEKTAKMEQFTALMAIAKKFEVQDTRKNQIIRVCTAISAFISLGMDQKKVEEAIIGFDDGWSAYMTEPLAQIIGDELKAKQDAEAPCEKFLEINNQNRDAGKPEQTQTKKVIEKPRKATVQ